MDRREHDDVFGPKVVKLVGESVTLFACGCVASARCGRHTSRTRLFRSLGVDDVSQGVAGFRLGAPNRIDAVVLDSGAEVSDCSWRKFS